MVEGFGHLLAGLGQCSKLRLHRLVTEALVSSEICKIIKLTESDCWSVLDHQTWWLAYTSQGRRIGGHPILHLVSETKGESP